MNAKIEQRTEMMPEMREACAAIHEGETEAHCMGMMQHDETIAHAPENGEVQ